MAAYLDIAAWPRRKHYDLFRSYERPFFNICANVDVTALKSAVKANDKSFFLSCLYLSTAAANRVEPFRYRLREDGVLIHDVVHPGSTVLMPDDTFGFAYFEFDDRFDVFHSMAEAELDAIRSFRKSAFDLRDDRDDLIHYSVIPWISFTSFAHARRLIELDSTPKIVLGKYYLENSRLMMPVSVEVHHALVDGLHVGQYFDQLQQGMAEAAKLLIAK
ncbi:MAG: chloramphenicol acetyltransferase [Rhodothermia bacterium]|nr:chloramphenicol acetyltransferase [Rhodothermia bacterium]